MNHIFGFIVQFLGLFIVYVNVVILLIFDAIVFSYPLIFINNYILVEKYSAPTLNYYEGVLLIFLFKLIAILWKSVTMNNISNNNKKEEENVY